MTDIIKITQNAVVEIDLDAINERLDDEFKIADINEFLARLNAGEFRAEDYAKPVFDTKKYALISDEKIKKIEKLRKTAATYQSKADALLLDDTADQEEEV